MNSIKHQYSKLLTAQENDLIAELHEPRQQSICTTVAQIYLTRAPFHCEWIFSCTAVLCLIKDNNKKTFYFRAYSFEKLLWKEELYKNMEYIRDKLFLHSFEGQENMVAFNFVHVQEAEEFFDLVQKKIWFLSKNKTTISNTRTKKLNKLDIGTPVNFKHLQHVGFDIEKGFDIKLTSAELKSFFDKSGIDSNTAQSKETKKVIKSFIDKYGEESIYEAITYDGTDLPACPPRTLSNESYTPSQSRRAFVPSKSAPSQTSTKIPPTLPMIPARNVPTNVDRKPPPTMPPPPPPPPILSPPTPPATLSLNQSVPPLQQVINTISDDRANLLESIRRGSKLKPVNERMLNTTIPQSPKKESVLDIRSALQQALSKRSNALASDKSSDDDNDSNNSDWE